MPCDYTKYHPEWKTVIHPRILKRADNKCEECGIKNYDVGYRDKLGNFFKIEKITDALDNSGYDYFEHELSNIEPDENPIKIVLTIARLDHNIENNKDDNLKALCQRCHLRHDASQHVETRRKKKNQFEMEF